MVYTNFWATLSSFVGIFVTGEGITAMEFCRKYPEILPELFYLAILSAFGQTFIFLTIKEFGSLKSSLITTTRKFVQVLLNTFYFGRSLTAQKWVAVVIVFAGVLFDRYGDYLGKKAGKPGSKGVHEKDSSGYDGEGKKLGRKKAE